MKKLIILLGDTIILYGALWLTLKLRYGAAFDDALWQVHFWPFTIVFGIWLVVFFINDLYALKTARTNLAFFNLLGKTLFICGALAFAFFYLTPGDLIDIRPKTNLILDLVIVAVLLTLWRHLFNKIVGADRLAQNILLVGLNEKSRTLIDALKKNPQFGYRVVAVVPLPAEPSHELDDITLWESLDDFETRLDLHHITSIVTTESHRSNPQLADILLNVLKKNIEIHSFHTFYERTTGKVPVASIDHTWFLEHIAGNHKRLYEIAKRITDIMLALGGLLVSLPFVPFIWVAIKVDDPGSSFFTQHRAGKSGKKFLAIKFRTMRRDAESQGPQWAIPNDPRVTRVGRALRKTRIDELPQLVNILRGEMSFVGPRPERPEFIEQLKEKIPFYNERHLVKPGLTGWAQINFPYGSSESDALEKLQYDLYYIKNRSLILDLSILLKTIRIILSGSGQ